MNKKRKDAFLPKGIPRYIRLYDNDKTADRYTCVFTGRYRHNTGGSFWYLGMSTMPFHPQGIGQHGEHHKQIDRPTYGHLGKKIAWADLPEDCQKFIMTNYLYLWDFTDEDGNEI